MPKMMILRPNAGYAPPEKATAAEKAALKKEFDAIKARGDVRVPAATAMEGVGRAKGMYVIAEAEQDGAAAQPAKIELEDMPPEQLKIMMLQLGVTMQKKQMHKADMVAIIRRKLEEIEVVDGDEDSDTPED
jgi:hypothetical protein